MTLFLLGVVAASLVWAFLLGGKPRPTAVPKALSESQERLVEATERLSESRRRLTEATDATTADLQRRLDQLGLQPPGWMSRYRAHALFAIAFTAFEALLPLLPADEVAPSDPGGQP